MRLSQDNEDDDKLKNLFLKLFLDEVEKCSNKSKTRWLLDFIRLNIIAHKP
jgi:trans-aconitate 2-methyltransferase